MDVSELHTAGYIGISNKFCIVGRIDRSDWLEVMAKARLCTVADFYALDGSGVDERHKEHYIRVHSKDTITVDPLVYKSLKQLTNF